MKNLKILGGLLIAYALNSCGLFPDVLPDETQSGKNTFGCLVNGKVFKADDFGNNYDGNLSIRGINGDFGVYFNAVNIQTTGTYTLEHKQGLIYTDSKCRRGNYSVPINAKLIVTKFERGEDKANNLRWLIVSGRFEGIITPDSECKDTIKITQGRFDVRFQ